MIRNEICKRLTNYLPNKYNLYTTKTHNTCVCIVFVFLYRREAHYVIFISMCLRQSPHVALESVKQKEGKQLEREAKRGHRGAKRDPKVSKGSQKGAKGRPKGAQREPKCSQMTLSKMYRNNTWILPQFRILHPIFFKSVEPSLKKGGLNSQ